MSRHAQSLFKFTFSEQPKPRTHSTMIQPKSGDNDVVDALHFVRQGSRLILVENNTPHTWNEYFVTEDGAVMDASGGCVFAVSDIESVAMASELSVAHALQILDIGHVKPDGLEPLLFSVRLSRGENLLFIADSPRNCYIWQRALHALLKSGQDLESVPLLVSNRLRSATLVYGSPMNDGDEEETGEDLKACGLECVSTKHDVRIPQVLSEEWRYFEIQIDSIDHFVQVFCILDSSRHLTLLADALRLRNRLNDLEWEIDQLNKAGRVFHGWSQWEDIRERWWLLHADLAVTHLNLSQFQEEVGLKH